MEGFEIVKERIVTSVECDRSIAAIFGLGLDSSGESVDAGLKSYIEDLRSKTGKLLSL
jgi:hypothetical protein